MDISRRSFLWQSAAAGGAVLALHRGAHAAGSDTIRVGLVGCGDRGTGAALNALNADPGVRLVALADAFDNRLQTSLAQLKKLVPERVDVDRERCFVGFDGYKQLIASGVDVVLLASPPHFRPLHVAAAIEAGKHVFAEKPVAVDPAGVRRVQAACELARKKSLNVVSGLCWRYNTLIRETMQRVHDGAIGRVIAAQSTRNVGYLWQRPRKPEWTEMEFQLRNWLYFTWLSGDHIVEGQVHGIDKCSWALGEEQPLRAWGTGGRQVRVESKWGEIFDHHAVVYEYASGARLFALGRQQAGCFNDNSEVLLGTKGRCDLQKGRIEGETNWCYRARPAGAARERDRAARPMYQIEHDELFAAIRAGRAINNGHYMCQSTLMAVLGRLVGYTGQQITWEQITRSQLDLSPKTYALDAPPPALPGADGKYSIPTPGVTKFI
jgi:predicted dehydrogenase